MLHMISYLTLFSWAKSDSSNMYLKDGHPKEVASGKRPAVVLASWHAAADHCAVGLHLLALIFPTRRYLDALLALVPAYCLGLRDISVVGRRSSGLLVT